MAIMFIKTVVNEPLEGAKAYKCYCRAKGSDEFQDIELSVVEKEYDDAFAEKLSCEVSKYYVHTIYDYDYESSGDAGDGRDDCYTEEGDLQIDPENCIIKDGEFFGVECESFERKAFVSVDLPEAIISHPGNYGGRNYHFYRSKRFILTAKE